MPTTDGFTAKHGGWGDTMRGSLPCAVTKVLCSVVMQTLDGLKVRFGGYFAVRWNSLNRVNEPPFSSEFATTRGARVTASHDVPGILDRVTGDRC